VLSFILCPLTRLQGGACGALAGQEIFQLLKGKVHN
jgi:hypothetical protein